MASFQMLVAFLLFQCVICEVKSNATRCPDVCSCYSVQRDGDDRLSANCRLGNESSFRSLPNSLYSLNMSNSGLKEVPSTSLCRLTNLTLLFLDGNHIKVLLEGGFEGLKQLTELSLERNAISTIEEGAFNGLAKLLLLNLRFNNLSRWYGHMAKELPSLTSLDLTGNALWVPDERLLNLTTLREVRGVTWSSICSNCTLIRIDTNTTMRKHGNGKGGDIESHSDGIPPGGSEIQRRSLAREPGDEQQACQFPPPISGVHWTDEPPMSFQCLGFFVKCPTTASPEEKGKCSVSIIRHHGGGVLESITLSSRFFYCLYPLGGIAILLNLLIIVCVAASKPLRNTVSMLLITNVAVCDLLIGVYSILMAKLNIFKFLSQNLKEDSLIQQEPQDLTLGGGVLCPLATALFTSGEIVSAGTSLLLTVEKYCSIVYCMKPDVRLRKRTAVACLCFLWCSGLLYGISPRFGVLGLSYSATQICTMPVTEMKTFVVTLGVLILLYLSNIPLYGKIFVFVRHSGSRLGIRREAVLLKKIALLVCTNFLFLLVPMILIIIFVFVLSIHNTLLLSDTSSPHATQAQYLGCYWLPVVLFSFNACLDPFLCAFRQPQFQRNFRKLFKPRVQAPIRHITPFGRSEVSSSQIVLFRITPREL